jgi:23S rRNA (pseudouridine1915-N3)-methyltransferase
MQLAAHLERWRTEAINAAFAIGSADGLDPALKRDADEVLALSSMTLPHGLVRVMLAEQLYRAVTINAGHPYHRE